jgi:hypothetical protein
MIPRNAVQQAALPFQRGIAVNRLISASMSLMALSSAQGNVGGNVLNAR